jgi:hypothetical protein
MLAADVIQRTDPLDIAPVGEGTLAAPWQPSGADEALAAFNRISCHCVFSCATGPDDCLEDQCRAWNLERAAAGYLAGRWLDAQD